MAMLATVNVILSRLNGDPPSGFVYGTISVSYPNGPSTVILDYPKTAPTQIAVGSAFFLTVPSLTVPSGTTLTIRADLHNAAWMGASDAIVNTSKDFRTPATAGPQKYEINGPLGDINGTITWRFV